MVGDKPFLPRLNPFPRVEDVNLSNKHGRLMNLHGFRFAFLAAGVIPYISTGTDAMFTGQTACFL